MRCFGRSNGKGASRHESLMASWGLPLSFDGSFRPSYLTFK